MICVEHSDHNLRPARFRCAGVLRAVVLLAGLIVSCGTANADSRNCVYVFHDEAGAPRTPIDDLVLIFNELKRILWGAQPSPALGPERTLAFANLLGHWPHYEVRVRPIWEYRAGQIEDCHATFYVGTSDNTIVPTVFVGDFFRTSKQVTWVGLGARKLDQRLMQREFHHRVDAIVSIADAQARVSGFYNRVFYKGEKFDTELDEKQPLTRKLFTVKYVPTDAKAGDYVLGRQAHSNTSETIPYILRADNKFLIADIPFESNETQVDDRYLVFADLLFDILNEKPLHATAIALGRLEDIHGFYELTTLSSALAAFRDENVPVNIAHIPLFVDPKNLHELGEIPDPRPPKAELIALLTELAKDPRNAILWHGVTHQLGTGTTGHDHEFWVKINSRPVPVDSVEWVLDRLSAGLSVFQSYQRAPRFWVTPHYEASALDNIVFGRVFPWIVGGVSYFSSSFKGDFTLRTVDPRAAQAMPSVTSEVLEKVRTAAFGPLDRDSKGRIAQDFPFEIYRDVYGQRVIPETLGYVSTSAPGKPGIDVDKILATARRNLVIRDMWGSFFFHPYLLVSKERGGIGRFDGDNSELRRLIVGLRDLGYRFLSLDEFEQMLGPALDVRQKSN